METRWSKGGCRCLGRESSAEGAQGRPDGAAAGAGGLEPVVQAQPMGEDHGQGLGFSSEVEEHLEAPKQKRTIQLAFCQGRSGCHVHSGLVCGKRRSRGPAESGAVAASRGGVAMAGIEMGALEWSEFANQVDILKAELDGQDLLMLRCKGKTASVITKFGGQAVRVAESPPAVLGKPLGNTHGLPLVFGRVGVGIRTCGLDSVSLQAY